MNASPTSSAIERKAATVLAAHDNAVLINKLPTARPMTRRLQEWRNKEKVKTQHALIALCLNVGIDPPDVVKMKDCAKLECWTDPLAAQAQTLQKPTEVIGEKLVEQYKNLQKINIAKAGTQSNYRYILEPSVDELKRELAVTRKRAKDGRVLFHYNGHGCPKATPYGEIWFFDRDHTQYVPVPITEIMACLGSPTVYVFECSNAGAILYFWYKSRYHESRKNDIIIAACKAYETLPMNPNLPADLLTSCLTTPINMSLEWYFLYAQRERLLPNITYDMLPHLPGTVNDRKSPMGELNWIFTAVTDTIAWCTLSRPMFLRLFRQDLLLVSLFRNFLLAERIMRETGCAPVSHPQLPPKTWNHYMWDAWDVALESILSQLPEILNNPHYQYKPTSFFSDQLTSFEIWIEFGTENDESPDQLPCIIQGLSSAQHRSRTLGLLAKYLDLGPWAVNDALSCGIMPYVMKFLSNLELMYMLVVIWVKILSLDKTETTLSDLYRTQSHRQFMKILQPPTRHSGRSPRGDPNTPTSPAVKNASDFNLSGMDSAEPHDPLDTLDQNQSWPPQKGDFREDVMIEHTTTTQCCAMSCYILCLMFDGLGLVCQYDCWNHQLFSSLLSLTVSGDPQLRSWVCLTIGKLLHEFEAGKAFACNEKIYKRLVPLLTDPCPDVRAACVYAMSKFIGDEESLSASRASALKDSSGQAGLFKGEMWRPRALSGSKDTPQLKTHWASMASIQSLRGNEFGLDAKCVKNESLDDLTSLERNSYKGSYHLDSSSHSRSQAAASPTSGEDRTKAEKFGVEFSIWLQLSASVHDPSPNVRQELVAATALYLMYYRQFLKSDSLRDLQEKKPPGPRTSSPLSKYLYNPETTSVLSRDHFTDNPHITGSEPQAFTVQCPQFSMPCMGSHVQGGPILGHGSPSKPTRPGDKARVSSKTSEYRYDGSDSGSTPASMPKDKAPRKWIDAMRTLNMQDIKERKAQLVADLCEVLNILQHDPYQPVVDMVHSVVMWLQTVSVPNSTKDQVWSVYTEQAQYSTIANRFYANMEAPIFHRDEEEEDETGADYDEGYVSKLDSLMALFKQSAGRAFTPGPQFSLEPICLSGSNNTSVKPSESVVATCFQSFDPHIITADNNNGVQVCAYHNPNGAPVIANDVFGSQLHRIQEAKILNSFSHSNALAPKESKGIIRTMHVINDHLPSPQLLVTDGYGQVSVYANFTLAKEQYIAAAFRVPETQSGQYHNVITDWHQKTGLLYYGANTKIQIYDMQELRVFQSIQIPNSQLTAVHCDHFGGALLFGGFQDGTIRIWDKRQSNASHHHSLVCILQDTNASGSSSSNAIVNCVFKSNAIFSGSANGLVKVWDLRRRSVHRQIDTRSPMINFDAHSHLPLFATVHGPDNSNLQVYNTKGDLLTSRHRVNPASRSSSTIAFHPLKSYVAVDKEVLYIGERIKD